MTEGLFILTTLFVAYVVYAIMNEKKAGGVGKSSAAAAPAKAQATAAEKPKSAPAKAKAPAKKATPAKPKAIVVKEAAAPKATVAKAAPAKPKTAVAKVAAAPKSAVVKVAAAPKPAVAKVAPVPKVAVVKAVAAVKPVAKKPVKAATSTPPVKKPEPVLTPASATTLAEGIKSTGLKDPKTGEVVTAYGNYRFTKRWVKEALVAEKLVDKVYKNDELNADIEGKIRAGIIKLEAMKKYQP